MNEAQVKDLIMERFGSINAFSESINLANSTVVSILERGFLNAKLKNVFTICKALGLNPEDLESGFTFVPSTSNIVHGDNHGINGITSGDGVTNNFNFDGKDSQQRNHNTTMQNLGTADLRLQRSLLNRIDELIAIKRDEITNQVETNKKLDLIIDLLTKP